MNKEKIERMNSKYDNYVININKLDTTKTYELYPTGNWS